MSNFTDQIAARTSSIARQMIRDHLRQQQSELEMAINATPTGDVRNKLCDANIHLQVAVSLIHEAEEIGAKNG